MFSTEGETRIILNKKICFWKKVLAASLSFLLKLTKAEVSVSTERQEWGFKINKNWLDGYNSNGGWQKWLEKNLTAPQTTLCKNVKHDKVGIACFLTLCIHCLNLFYFFVIKVDEIKQISWRSWIWPKMYRFKRKRKKNSIQHLYFCISRFT